MGVLHPPGAAGAAGRGAALVLPLPPDSGGRGQLPGSLPGRARHLLLLQVPQGEDEEAAGGAVGQERAVLDQQGDRGAAAG